MANAPRKSDLWTCGPFRPENITPIESHLVKALGLLPTMLRDENGRKPVGFRLPPALAMAIIHVMREAEPQQAAQDLVLGRRKI